MIKRCDIRSVVGLAHNSLHLISPTKQRGPFTLCVTHTGSPALGGIYEPAHFWATAFKASAA